MDLAQNGTKNDKLDKWIILSHSHSITGSLSNDDGDKNVTYLRIQAVRKQWFCALCSCFFILVHVVAVLALSTT